MNQILVTEKLYVTPELKRKKKFYRICFIISIFVIIALASFYVYAEYDKARTEGISKDILSDINNQTEIIERKAQEEAEEDKVWKIIISSRDENSNPNTTNVNTNGNSNSNSSNNSQTRKNNLMNTKINGKQYETVGSISIPKISINYPILAETSVDLLKISPCKFYGPDANEVGNLCIAGHNWKNSKFFSKVPSEIVNGDVIEITDTTGRTIKYSVYDKYTVVPEDTSCTTQKTNGKKIVTLITCTNDNKKE